MHRIYPHPDGLDPFDDPLDAFLADIAISVQLPPGLHAKADARYEAVRTYAEREGSPLHGLIRRFYPQGSMAIDGTISTRGTDDEFDLDIVASLDVAPEADPDAVLDALYRSLDGYPTGRAVERQTRCVTVRYADRMHLDITPASRLPGDVERESHIFHANPDEPRSKHGHVPMNAYGFAAWYRDRTPLEPRFAKSFNGRMFAALDGARAAAEVDDIPEQVPLIVKSVTTVALQLLKRFRNVTYAGRSGRIPPSVMMSCFAGHAAEVGIGLTDMVIRQARLIAMAIRRATERRETVMVVNPTFPRDCFTDRWPENLSQQEEFAAKLTALADGLVRLRRNGADLETMRDWLREQFGDRVVTASLQRFNARTGRAVRTGTQAYSKKQGVYVPSAPAIIGLGSAAASSKAIAATPHTFRGDPPR
ncbi:MAG: nucleotidyltransferase domain-containing protein [Janthinobacterium lividum]